VGGTAVLAIAGLVVALAFAALLARTPRENDEDHRQEWRPASSAWARGLAVLFALTVAAVARPPDDRPPSRPESLIGTDLERPCRAHRRQPYLRTSRK
jgi:hypothetical protein